MQVFKKLCLLAMAGCIIEQATATSQQDLDYPSFAKAMNSEGLDWEPHQVTTEDGWLITVFRIVGRRRNGPGTAEHLFERPEHASKYPVYMLHAQAGNAVGMTGTWVPELTDAGYDVWLGNIRGTKFGNVNIKDSQAEPWSLKDRWNHTMADYGNYDAPAQIERMLEVTGKEKVTLFGYSQGTFVLFYSLAKKQDWWADKVNRFIPLAACLIVTMEKTNWNQEVTKFLSYDQLGYYNWHGEDASSADKDVVCGQIHDIFAECDDEKDPGDDAFSLASMSYWMQLSLAQRFQEPIPLQEWAKGTIYSDPIELSWIDRTPVTVIHPIDDEICPVENAEWYFHEVGTADKHFVPIQGFHLSPMFNFRPEYVPMIKSIIETGSYGGAKSGFSDIFSQTVVISAILAFMA